MMPTLPAFDIFSGHFGKKNVVWLGTVEGWARRVIACFSLPRSNLEHILFSARIANLSWQRLIQLA
jgi:hypothetical protein